MEAPGDVGRCPFSAMPFDLSEDVLFRCFLDGTGSRARAVFVFIEDPGDLGLQPAAKPASSGRSFEASPSSSSAIKAGGLLLRLCLPEQAAEIFADVAEALGGELGLDKRLEESGGEMATVVMAQPSMVDIRSLADFLSVVNDYEAWPGHGAHGQTPVRGFVPQRCRQGGPPVIRPARVLGGAEASGYRPPRQAGSSRQVETKGRPLCFLQVPLESAPPLVERPDRSDVAASIMSSWAPGEAAAIAHFLCPCGAGGQHRPLPNAALRSPRAAPSPQLCVSTVWVARWAVSDGDVVAISSQAGVSRGPAFQTTVVHARQRQRVAPARAREPSAVMPRTSEPRQERRAHAAAARSRPRRRGLSGRSIPGGRWPRTAASIAARAAKRGCAGVRAARSRPGSARHAPCRVRAKLRPRQACESAQDRRESPTGSSRATVPIATDNVSPSTPRRNPPASFRAAMPIILVTCTPWWPSDREAVRFGHGSRVQRHSPLETRGCDMDVVAAILIRRLLESGAGGRQIKSEARSASIITIAFIYADGMSGSAREHQPTRSASTPLTLQIRVEHRVRTASRCTGPKRMIDRDYRISDPHRSRYRP